MLLFDTCLARMPILRMACLAQSQAAPSYMHSFQHAADAGLAASQRWTLHEDSLWQRQILLFYARSIAAAFSRSKIDANSGDWIFIFQAVGNSNMVSRAGRSCPCDAPTGLLSSSIIYIYRYSMLIWPGSCRFRHGKPTLRRFLSTHQFNDRCLFNTPL